jgi:molybdopterin adenylyltransferase
MAVWRLIFLPILTLSVTGAGPPQPRLGLVNVSWRRAHAGRTRETTMNSFQPLLVGILTASDRASAGVYRDESGPAIEQFLRDVVTSPWRAIARVVPDGVENVQNALIDLTDREGCGLIFTTGGTGPAPRDLTPEATQAVCARLMPGFGELMRAESLKHVPTAILSRQTAGIRDRSLIVNLPGRPASIRVCLDAVFPAIPYCLDLIGRAGVETNPALCKAFRPKS